MKLRSPATAIAILVIIATFGLWITGIFVFHIHEATAASLLNTVLIVSGISGSLLAIGVTYTDTYAQIGRRFDQITETNERHFQELLQLLRVAFNDEENAELFARYIAKYVLAVVFPDKFKAPDFERVAPRDVVNASANAQAHDEPATQSPDESGSGDSGRP